MSAVVFKHFAPSKISLFLRRGLSLTPPIYLNDAFEFAAPVDPTPEKEVHAWFDRFVRDEYDKASVWTRLLPLEQFREQLEHFRAGYVEAFRCSDFLKVSSHFIWETLRTFWGVTCFTEVPDNRLMWAHYSDSLKGFVAEFATDGEDVLHDIAVRWSKFGPLLKVTYQAPPPRLAWRCSNTMKCCCTKHSDWSYEREWRVVLPMSVGKLRDDTTHRYIQFPPESLRRVICGNQMSSEDRQKLRTMLSESCFAHVSWQIAFPNLETHEIQINSLTN